MDLLHDEYGAKRLPNDPKEGRLYVSHYYYEDLGFMIHE
jgi:hypothetical protein